MSDPLASGPDEVCEALRPRVPSLRKKEIEHLPGVYVEAT